jgi:hypothetical protein
MDMLGKIKSDEDNKHLKNINASDSMNELDNTDSISSSNNKSSVKSFDVSIQIV